LPHTPPLLRRRPRPPGTDAQPTGVEIEHLRSDCATGVFSALAAATPTPATARATTPRSPRRDGRRPAPATHRRALRRPCAARHGLPADGRRPAHQSPGRQQSAAARP